MKHVTKEIFLKLTSLVKSDFMFFISSFYILRFKEHPAFKKYIETENIKFNAKNTAACHRIIYKYYNSLLKKRSYYLGQFSIKKGSNIYGLIFGSNNHLGMKKFLDVAWRIDPFTGDANHDIDSDVIRSGQLQFDYDGSDNVNKVKKLVAYEENLLQFLSEHRGNQSIYKHSLENGISIKNTNNILKKLERNGNLEFRGNARRKGAFYLNLDTTRRIEIKAK